MNDIADFKIIMNGRDVIGLREEIEAGQKTLDRAWDEINDLRKKLTLALEAEARAHEQSEALADAMRTIYPYVKDKRVYGRTKKPDGSILNIHIGGVIEKALVEYEKIKGGSA